MDPFRRLQRVQGPRLRGVMLQMPFTADQFFAVFEGYNRSVWPPISWAMVIPPARHSARRVR
jgi:hypothetical protein